jgi:exodeoxyribonuclease VII small subunit
LSQAKKPETFEQSIERLEALVKEMEAGGLPLEDMLRRYEEGMALSQALKGQLEKIQGRLSEVRLAGDAPVEEPAEYTP